MDPDVDFVDAYLGVDPPAPSDLPALSVLGRKALAYARQGQPVFPCEPGGKRPLGRFAPNGFKDATTDPDTIRRWWLETPDANIAVPTGLPTTATVLDVDIKPEQGIRGDLAYEGLVALNGELPVTRLQLTPSGGKHPRRVAGHSGRGWLHPRRALGPADRRLHVGERRGVGPDARVAAYQAHRAQGGVHGA